MIKKVALVLAIVLAFSLPAMAEVEEITVGGEIQIRGQWLDPGLDIPEFLPYPGISGLVPIGFTDDISDMDWVTQRTRVNVDAKLSGGVRGFVELQAYDIWGVDVDDIEYEAIDPLLQIGLLPEQETTFEDAFAGQGNEIVHLYQAYIEMNDIGDYPLQLRIGRQELAFGREWLVGNNDAGVNFSGLSFDAVKAKYETDMFRVDAWWAKLVDLTNPILLGLAGEVEEDGDIDFYGVYATCTAVDNMVFDVYWLYERNGIQFAGFDTNEVTQLHTIGGRWAGEMELGAGILDYNVEGAYQFGDNNVPAGSDGGSGDFEAWAFNAMAGYTFSDVQWTPRIEAEYAYFSGDDDAFDGDTEEFNRMFSDVHYGELNLGGNLDNDATNLHILRLGASALPMEKLTVSGDFYFFWLAEDANEGLGKTFGVPQWGTYFEGWDTDDDVGYELDIIVDYQYTEDLNLRVGWAHFFAGDAIEKSWGSIGPANENDDDVDYVYAQAKLVF